MIKSWMVIGGVTILLALLNNLFLRPDGIKWFKRLRRPQWLSFEALIPFIWTFIFACAAWSAWHVWERNPGSPTTWLLMGGYVLLEVVTLSYTTVMLAVKRLKVGIVLGGAGGIVALFLALTVWPISSWAALLLVPYLLWSPIGTYTTWQMTHLNPGDA